MNFLSIPYHLSKCPTIFGISVVKWCISVIRWEIPMIRQSISKLPVQESMWGISGLKTALLVSAMVEKLLVAWDHKKCNDDNYHDYDGNDYDDKEDNDVDNDLNDGGWLKGLSDGRGWLGGRLRPSSKANRFSCLIRMIMEMSRMMMMRRRMIRMIRMIMEMRRMMTMTTLTTFAWHQPLVQLSSAGFLEAEAPLRPPGLIFIIIVITIILIIIIIVILRLPSLTLLFLLLIEMIINFNEITINKDLAVAPHGASSDDREDILWPWEWRVSS